MEARLVVATLLSFPRGDPLPRNDRGRRGDGYRNCDGRGKTPLPSTERTRRNAKDVECEDAQAQEDASLIGLLLDRRMRIALLVKAPSPPAERREDKRPDDD